MRGTKTIRLTRRKLPHWEVEDGRYFVTVRCADSLPASAVLQLQELHGSVNQLIPRSPEFAALQRQIFRGLEKYLAAGFGACPLRQPVVASNVIEELTALADWEIAVPHFAVMPNHWHALMIPKKAEAYSLSAVMKRLKGRTAKRIRRLIGGSGTFWQSEWFDRWVRDDKEWDRITSYIQNNPVKAGLAPTWPDHPSTK